MFQRVLIVFQVLLAVIYSSSGLSKLFHWFPNIIGPISLIEELSKYNLGLFGYFIAVTQAIVGILLFFPKFRLIASILLLPMHLCITVIPISLGWHGTPFVNSVLLLMILALLYSERNRLMLLVGNPSDGPLKNSKIVYWSAFVLFWVAAVVLKYGSSL